MEKQFNRHYLAEVTEKLNSFSAFFGQDKADYSEAIDHVVAEVINVEKNNRKILMVGNGGSAGITSHMALDFWKNAGVRAMAFNDPSLLTALGNDIGYEFVFSKSVEKFADEGDILFAISSSGNSSNIVNAAIAAKKAGCKVVTFSGFSLDNRLLQNGDIHFFVNSKSYGIVEVLHTLIIHNILDNKLYNKDKIDIYNKNMPL